MINKVTLIGRVGKNPETAQVGQTQVSKFSLATSESWKDKQGEKQTNTQWHNITCWGPLAEKFVSQYVKQGDQVGVFGKIEYGNYEKDGIKHYTVEIVADDVKILGSKMQEIAPKDPAQAPEQSNLPAQDDDLPF